MFRACRHLLLIATFLASVACRVREGPPKQEAAAAPQTTPEGQLSPQVATNPGNPLAAYVRRAKADEFNPDVTDAERRNPRPKRGGTLVVRIPGGDVASLNPLLQTAQTEQILVSYLTEYPESLVHRDLETLEYMPKMAEYWKVCDYIEMRDGKRIGGLITSSDTEPLVTIFPGASMWTFFLCDIVSSDTEAGLVATRFGHRLRGKLTTHDYTVMIEERPDTAPLTLAKNELSTWTAGTNEPARPSIKRRCIYEFRLRPGIQWHDGHPVTMEDAKCWFDTMRNPNVDCAFLRLYYMDIEKMDVSSDSMTAKFIYRKPYALALDYCGGAIFLPCHIFPPEQNRINPEGYAKFFNEHPLGQPGKGQFVGIGPYRLDHWTAGQEIVMVRDENYWVCRANLPWWDSQRPYLDKIVWRFIQQATPALREMENGNVDADFDLEPDTWRLPQTLSPAFTSRYVRARFITPSFTYIGWNERRDVFKDPQVRRALTMLIPRERIFKVIHYGLGRVIEGPFFVDGPCADLSVKPMPYDPAGARRILRRAGWIDRDGDGILDKDGQKFEFEYLVHTGREYHAKIADIIKQCLGRAGIQVNIRKVDFTVLAEAVRDHNFDAARFAWTDLLDTDPYQIWHSSQSRGRGSNYVGYSNKRVDELIEQGREEFDPIKRWAIFREVYRIIYEDQPLTFLFIFDKLAFYNRKYHGVKFYRFIPGYDFTEWYDSEQK